MGKGVSLGGWLFLAPCELSQWIFRQVFGINVQQKAKGARKSLKLKRGILQVVFSWDLHPPKQPKSLGSSGIEGWVPLRWEDSLPRTSTCPAAVVWPQTQE